MLGSQQPNPSLTILKQTLSHDFALSLLVLFQNQVFGGHTACYAVYNKSPTGSAASGKIPGEFCPLPKKASHTVLSSVILGF